MDSGERGHHYGGFRGREAAVARGNRGPAMALGNQGRPAKARGGSGATPLLGRRGGGRRGGGVPAAGEEALRHGDVGWGWGGGREVEEWEVGGGVRFFVF